MVAASGHFRPDIEGLRAIAVLAVLAYHVRIPGIPGGYVGVDVFFVVSGFLITGLILRELDATGTLSLPTFYARRARRLLPAALVVIAATVIASAILLPPLRAGDVGLDGAAAALYVGNLRYAIQATDYLQAELDPSPLLHFWSLGVEEQFYLLWPALLVLAAGRHVDRRRIAIVVGAVAVASLGLSVALTPANGPLAFFILPTRAWELGAGAALALAADRLTRQPAVLSTILVSAGIGAVAVSIFAFDLTTPFPGTAAILPVAGAAAIIAGGTANASGVVSRLLGVAPMRWIGGISYSLYLWHWPLLVLPAAALESSLPGGVRVALAGAAFLLAIASRRWIEDPIRHGRVSRVRPAPMIAAAVGLSVIVAAGAIGIGATVAPRVTTASTESPTLVLSTLAPDEPATSERPPGSMDPGANGATTSPAASSARPSARPPTPGGPVPEDLVPSLGAVRDDIPVVYDDGCHAQPLDLPDITGRERCVYGDPDATTAVVLIGDSHAAQWFPAFERIAKDRGWRFVSLTKSACPAVRLTAAIVNGALRRTYPECAAWLDLTLARIALERPALVVISNSHGGRLLIDGAEVPMIDRDDLWGPGLTDVIGTVRATGASVVVIGDTPDPQGDPPVCLSDHLDDAGACTTPRDRAVFPSRLATEREVADATGATFIDPTDWLCPTEPCPALIGRLLIYRDGHHMTTPFATALAPYLEPLLPAIGP